MLALTFNRRKPGYTERKLPVTVGLFHNNNRLLGCDDPATDRLAPLRARTVQPEAIPVREMVLRLPFDLLDIRLKMLARSVWEQSCVSAGRGPL
jgi:FAD synthase